MNLRRNSGATLAFVAGSIIFIVFIAVAFFFLSQLLGGGRELQHATNSGTLNVAKDAMARPAVPVPIDGMAEAKDMKEILLGVTQDAGDSVNLLTFNRMVGAAMLVAMNAEADGNTAGDGSMVNAGKFIDLVEGKSSSVGSTLAAALKNGPSWAREKFNDTAAGNSLRMLGETTQINWQDNDFKVAYLDPGMPSNVNLNFLKADPPKPGDDPVNNLPFNNIHILGQGIDPDGLTRKELPGGITKKDKAGDQLLLGYTAMSFGGVGRTLYAVPLDTAPHLVSLNDFNKKELVEQPGADKNIVIPPNTFMNGALGRDQRKTKSDVHMLAAAMAGTSQRPFEVSMPFGYIVLDNHKQLQFQGVVPNSNNVFARELGAGIDVDPTSKYFDNAEAQNEEPQIRKWHETPRNGPDGTPSSFDPNSGPEFDKIFDNFGEPVASKQQVADHVPYYEGGSPAVKCTHSKSDASSPGAVSQCVNLASPSGTNPAGMSPFDWAYHRGEDQTYGSSGKIDTKNLTAAEQTGCKVIDTWEKATKKILPEPWQADFNFATTGIRLYPEGHNPIQGNSVPWGRKGEGFDQHIGDAGKYSQAQPCQVTTAGTMAQLIDQTAGFEPDRSAVPKALSAQAKAAEKIVKQRMHEILPASAEVIDKEYKDHVATARLDLGSVNYVYLDPATKHFKVSTYFPDTNTGEEPAWVKKATLRQYAWQKTDGRKTQIATQNYGIGMTMADAKHQWGIHDTPFLRVDGQPVVPDPGKASAAEGNNSGNGKIRAHDEVIITPNSGAFGNLLNVSFQEKTTGDGVGFTDRN